MTVRFRAEKTWGRCWKEIVLIPSIQISINNPRYIWKNTRVFIWFFVFILNIDFIAEGKENV